MKIITNLPQHLGGVKWDDVEEKPDAYPPSSHTHSKSDVGLGSVDNTADANKSVKYAASAGNADTVDGKHASEFSPSNHTHNYAGSASSGGAANSANKLSTARAIRTNLASIAAANFDGSGDVSPGVIGILQTGNGGVGNAYGRVQVGQTSRVEVGYCATAEGWNVNASGMFAHAEGGHYGDQLNEATGISSHVEGSGNIASGDQSHAGGALTTASGSASFSGGRETVASGNNSFSGGAHTIASAYAQMVTGYWNVQYGDVANNINSYLIVGNGSESARSNAFRVHSNGACYGKSAWNSSGADYAEYYEWLDKNERTEDRRGYFVTMVGKEIVKATPKDDYILGIVSAHPVVIGNSDPDNWHGRFLKDVFGNFIMKKIIEKVPVGINEDGEEIFEEVEREAYVQNPDFDESQDADYISRDQRPEWSPIGMVGMLTVWDDGTCEVDGFCKCNRLSGATKANPVEYEIIDGKIRKNYRVVERVNDELIRVIFR